MPINEILAGRNLLTERPIPDKQYRGMSYVSGDSPVTRKPVFVALAYDTRHLAADNVPYLYVADDANRKIITFNSSTMDVISSSDYPSIVDSLLVENLHLLNDAGAPLTDAYCRRCMGLAVLYDGDDSTIAFLSEPLLGTKTEGSTDYPRYPVLYYMKMGEDQLLHVENWTSVDAGPADAEGFVLLEKDNELGYGMSEYHGDLLTIGKYDGVPTIMTISRNGQPLAYHPAFTADDELCGVQYINGRTYTTMNYQTDVNVSSRILAKYLTEQIDSSRMVPLMSIEPFFIEPQQGVALKRLIPNYGDDMQTKTYYYGPDITIFQDRMAACFMDNIYTFRMAYFAFIVDGQPNDDIDMGSVLIGDYKVKKVTLKNIADVYNMRDISLTVDKAGMDESKSRLREAADWVFFANQDPSTDPTDLVTLAKEHAQGVTLPTNTVWSPMIAMATQPPYLAPDGEIFFWVGIGIPEEYVNPTDAGQPVSVDDGPYAVPVVMRAMLG